MKTKSFVLPLVLLTLAVFTAKAQSVINITPDEQVLLRNPMQGWVIYAGLGDGLADNFWSLYDDFDCVDDGVAKKVKVSDYATTLYIRAAWSLFNPSEDVYVWDEGQENTVATAYRYNGVETKQLPFAACTETMEPVYTELPGWREKITATSQQAAGSIPEKLEAYIRFIEDYVGVPIKFVSYGPDRTQNIIR